MTESESSKGHEMYEAWTKARDAYEAYLAAGYGKKGIGWDDLSVRERESWIAVAKQQPPAAPPPPQGSPPVIPTNHIRPKHYKPDDLYEPLKVMRAHHGKQAVIWFCHLTAEKYLARAGMKAGEPKERDFRKAAFYLTHAAELLEEQEP